MFGGLIEKRGVRNVFPVHLKNSSIPRHRVRYHDIVEHLITRGRRKPDLLPVEKTIINGARFFVYSPFPNRNLSLIIPTDDSLVRTYVINTDADSGIGNRVKLGVRSRRISYVVIRVERERPYFPREKYKFMNKTFHGTKKIRSFAFYFRSETARTTSGVNVRLRYKYDKHKSSLAVCESLAVGNSVEFQRRKYVFSPCLPPHRQSHT